MLMNSALIRFNGFRIPRHVLDMLAIRCYFFAFVHASSCWIGLLQCNISVKKRILIRSPYLVTLSSLCGSQGTRGEPLGPGAAEQETERMTDGHAAAGSRKVSSNLDEVISLERR